MTDVYTQVEQLFADFGMHVYLGEEVTQQEHALQTAALAQAEGGSDALIAAALLHDVGHILVEDAHGAHHANVNAHHDDAGADWCAERFGSSVANPVRLHVDAKRYVVTIDPDYFATLSEASIHTLSLQGGRMDQREVADFERQDGWQEAVALRRWDDRAKIPGLDVPPLSEYRPLIERLAQARV
jgi:gamma-butyrobetaine dioxygenase